MTVTTNEFGQQNIFVKEPEMVIEEYNRKGLESPQQFAETYNGRWAMMEYHRWFHLLFQLVNSSLVSSDD